MSKKCNEAVSCDLYKWLGIGELSDSDLQFEFAALYEASDRVPGDHERVPKMMMRLAIALWSEANRRGLTIHPPASSDGPHGFDALPPTPHLT